ncbi:MAG: hypothetical protein K9M44_01640, partial [Candidatus Pacebacteria bacterium]|nr:hypothetical protein [Candidatus Paceibacterota bacterium]
GTTVSDTSVWSISANDTMNCQVRVDIENTKDENDYVKASIDVDNWTFKDVATGDTITDVVPSSDIAGSEMNVVAASLTVTQAATPPGATHVGGANMIEVNGFNFAAGNAEDITVTALTLHGYIDENNDGNVGDDYTVGVDNSVYFKDVLTSVELYANGTKIGETKTATTGGVVTFNSLNWTVEAGSTERLVVKGTLSSNSPYGGNSDYIQFLVNSVTAEYDAGTSVSPTISSVNTAGDVTVYQTITSAGTLTASLDAGTPDSSLITMATNDVVMTKIKFAATDEDFVVEELQIENAADTDDDAAYGPVTISYTNSAGQTETANAYFTANEANFSGLDILVPADDDTVVTVMADINTDAGGANNDTTTSLSLDGGDDFRAVAQDSGTVDADVSDVTGNSHYIYESVPTVAFAANTPSGDLIPSANGLLARIDITADANEDITFASSASNYITVQVATSGAAISSLVLKDADGNTLDTAATVTSGEATFMIGQSTDSDLTIPAGQTKTVLVYGDITGFTNAGDTVQIWLDDAAADIDWGIDGTGEYQRGNIIFKGDLYGGALVKP